MKKLLGLLILTLIIINPSKAEIFEFGNCIPGSNSQLKNLYNNQYSADVWNKFNTLYFKFRTKAEKIYGENSAWSVADTVFEKDLKEEDIKELLEDGYKKIKQYEKYIF